MRISDWSSDVCSSDLQRRGSETWALRTLVAAGWCVPSCALRATTPNPSSEDEGLRVYTPDCKNCIRNARPADCPGGRCQAGHPGPIGSLAVTRSEEHTSELQSLMRISYAVFCFKT